MKASDRQPIRRPVLVGVDGSDSARAAVDRGAWEAGRRHVPMLLVHGYQDKLAHASYGLLPRQPVVSAVRDDARAILEETADRARAEHPGGALKALRRLDAALRADLEEGGYQAAVAAPMPAASATS